MRLTDEELAEQHRRVRTPGHPMRQAALNELLLHYRPLARYVALKFARDAPQVDDFEQEALLALMKAISTYNGKAKFVTFATVVMRNRLIDITKVVHNPNRPQMVDLEHAREVPRHEDFSHVEEADLWERVDDLSGIHGIVLRLYYQESLTYQEIADRFGRANKAWAYKRVQAAIGMLRGAV